MSLPTYIRRRRVQNPAVYLADRLGSELGNALSQRVAQAPPAQLPAIMGEVAAQWRAPGLWTRVMQLLKEWERDYDGYYINPTKRHVRPYWMIPVRADEQVITLTAAGTPGAVARNITFEVDTQGHFEIASAMFVATSPDFLVEIFDANVPRFLQNREVHAAAVGGTARRPFLWPESYFLNVQEGKRVLNMNFRNLSTSTNVIRWVFHGRRWYHKEAPPNVQRAIQERFERMEKTYTYFLTLQPITPQNSPENANPPGVTLAAAQVLQENGAPFFTAEDQADTEVHKLSVFSTGAFACQLRERQSGRILSNGEVHSGSMWGDGEFPFPFHSETLLLERNYQLLFEVRDLSLATNKIFPVLTGRRLQYA